MVAVSQKPCRVTCTALEAHGKTLGKTDAAGCSRQEEVRCISRYEERTQLLSTDTPPPSRAEFTILPETVVHEDPNWYPLSPKPAYREIRSNVDTSSIPSAGSVHPNARLADEHGWMAKKDRANKSARMRDFHTNPGVCSGVAGTGAAGRVSDERRRDTPGGRTDGVGQWRSVTPDYHNRYAANLAGSSLPGVGAQGTFGEWTPPPSMHIAGLAPEKSTHGRTGWGDHDKGFASSRRMCAFDPRTSNLSESTEMKDFCRYHKEENLDKAKWQKGYNKAGMVMSSASAGQLRDMSILRSAAGLRMGNSISNLYGT